LQKINYFYKSTLRLLYELSNHLGNVLSVISDRRTAFVSATAGITAYYEPEVVSAQDYDPFGMLLADRTWQSITTYKYGFNGKENVDDVYGNDVGVDFGARIYDGRLGRWLSVDKKGINYIGNSPYLFGLDNPIIFIDTDGNGILNYTQLTTKGSGSSVSAAQLLEAGNFQGGYLKDNFGVDGINNKNNLDISFEMVSGLKNPNNGDKVFGMTGVYVITVSGGKVDLGTYVDNPDDPTDNVSSFEVAVKIESIDAPENQTESVIHEVTVHAIAYKDLIDKYYLDGNISQLVSSYNDLVEKSEIINHDDIGQYDGDFAKVCGQVIEGLTGPTYSKANVDYGYDHPNNFDENGNYIISPNSKEYYSDGSKKPKVTKNTVVNQFIYATNKDIEKYDTTGQIRVSYVWTDQ